MLTWFDGVKDLYRLLEMQGVKPTGLLVAQYLLYVNNREGNSGRVRVSDRELELRLGLSKQVVTDTKRYLKNIGWCDFVTDKERPRRGTLYELKYFTTGVSTFTRRQNTGQKLGQKLGQKIGQSTRISPNLSLERDHNYKPRNACARKEDEYGYGDEPRDKGDEEFLRY